jgi:hypothetical protein
VDIPNLGANFSMVGEHFQLFVTLLFALPLVSFVSIKCWIAARAGKVQRTTNWFVPTDLESEAARMHHGMGRNSVAFNHQARPNSRPAQQTSKIRRSA